MSNYALCIDNITVTNVVWAGTMSETVHYRVYRSVDGIHYDLIGYADADRTSYEDNDISASNFYYQVTAINTITGGTCESAPAMAVDGIHDYVTIHTDGVEEVESQFNVYPNPTYDVLFVETVGTSSQSDPTYRINNTMGQTVLTGHITNETQRIDVSNLPQGMYFITIEGATQKFVVK